MNEEHYFDGALYSLGDQRTDVYLQEIGGENQPKKLELTFVTGSGTYSIVDLEPEAVKRLGHWLRDIAKDVSTANSYLKDHKL